MIRLLWARILYSVKIIFGYDPVNTWLEGVLGQLQYSYNQNVANYESRILELQNENKILHEKLDDSRRELIQHLTPQPEVVVNDDSPVNITRSGWSSQREILERKNSLAAQSDRMRKIAEIEQREKEVEEIFNSVGSNSEPLVDEER